MQKQELHLEAIPRVKEISFEDFYEKYAKKQKPVVIENFTGDWNAISKWNLDYIKSIGGEKIVPLYDNRKSINTSKKKFNEPDLKMKLGEYIDLLKKGPTPYRIFLYNLLKQVPQLNNDFSYPKMKLRFLKGLPMLFFGGENSKVFMHYDIDYANILHFHFDGKKRCILYPQSETKYLYKLPNALIAHPGLDFNDPDFEKYPALNKAKGLVTELEHGNMLYMPEGYWHQMTYLTPGFSMSLRALPISKVNLSKAVYNVFFMRYFDNFMRKILGERWNEFKEDKALSRTNEKAA